MAITKEDLLKPEKAGAIIQAVIGYPKVKRQELILTICQTNVLLAARCLSDITSEQNELHAAIKQQALQLIENVANHDEVRQAILALFELKELKPVSQVFAQINNPEKTAYRRVIQDIISQNVDNSELLFDFLNILFENHRRSALPNKDYSQLPTHTLWMWALESLPDDVFMSGHQNKLALFYRFFVLQTQYSPTLHILPEKFGEFQDDIEKILVRHNKSAWLLNIYLNLIQRNPSAESTYIAKVKSTKQPLSVVVYNKLINYTNNFKTAVSLFAEMKQAGLTVNEITYSTLINKSQTYQQANELFDEMKQAGLTVNEITYNTLINKSQTYQQAIKLFAQMKQADLKVDETTYNTLINKSQTYQQAIELFDEMKQAGLKVDETTYNTLINKSQTYQQAIDLFDDMKQAGLKVDETTYNTLINKSQTYQQAIELFDDMKQAGLTVNERTYSTLINKSETYQQAIELFAQMKQAGLTVNETTYNTLINKSQTYQQAIELFDDMKQAGLKVDEISYSTLINKSQTYQQAIDLFADMKSDGLKPDVITFTTVLKKATKNKQPLNVILELLDEMISLKIKPSVSKGVDKKGNRLKPHTVYAVQDKLRRSQKPYRAWVQQKYQQLENQPRWLQDEWYDFFRQTLS